MERVFSHDLLQGLYETASSVLYEGASPSLLREPLEELAAIARFRKSEEGQRVVEEARRLHASGEIDIDRVTMAYHNGDDGYWVMGWCFVPDPNTQFGELKTEAEEGAIV